MPVVGTCGNCGGPVMTPELWGGAIPPTPECAHCGATPQSSFGPVIPMTPRKKAPTSRALADWEADPHNPANH